MGFFGSCIVELTDIFCSALISNDRKILTSTEGKENQSIQLEIKIDTLTDSPQGYKILWWMIILIIVAGVVLVAVVIVIIYLCCFRKKIKKTKKNNQEDAEKQQIRQQTNEIEINAEDERLKSDDKQKMNSSKPQHDEINQLIQKEPKWNFNPQISPQTISTPPTQQLQIQIQHSDQDLTPINPFRSNIIPVDNSGLNITSDKPSESILTPIDPSPSISSQPHHPTQNQKPIRSSSPGQSQKLQIARSLYPSHPSESSGGLHSYRPRTNQLPVRSISGQLPAYKPSGQQTVNSSSKVQPLNQQEQLNEKKH
ncbi:MAG: hypothetical protein EZS28_034013 [Streblomastix strix]|uniref:Uncharacterized protein n=1 Tax=Streblomastix strix TaxID=222440 RepID=A0A5J4UK30_9EUKA|nr:MAG: hypothetical protein EZS28_034013 [Streblomastix strix]